MEDKTSLPKLPPITPHLTVHDAAAAIDFYTRAFGAKLIDKQAMPNGTKLMHVSMAFPNGGMIMFHDDFPEMRDGKSRTPKALGGSPITIHVDLPDVDSAFKQAVDAGAEVTMPVADMFWGDRYGMLRDPFGHEWSLATRKFTPSDAERRAAADKSMGSK